MYIYLRDASIRNLLNVHMFSIYHKIKKNYYFALI